MDNKINIFFKRNLRRVIFLLFAFFLLELVLYIISNTFSEYKSFKHFLACVRKQIPLTNDEKTIYFVGDSTIAGFGSSDPDKYSLPAQLNQMFRIKFTDFRIINLGYAGSSTEEHLQILSLLPEGAIIIYRGGAIVPINDDNTYFHSRLLKMLSLFIFRFILPDVVCPIRVAKIHHKLQKIMDKKKFRLFIIDYTTDIQLFDLSGNIITPLYNYQGKNIEIIPLRDLQKSLGFRAEGKLEARFVSPMTGVHPNDAGYYLEAMLIFNYFCSRNYFGLSPNNEIAVSSIADFNLDICQRYQKILKELHNFTATDLIKKTERFKSITLEAYNLSSILQNFKNPQKPYKEEYKMLETLALLLIHDPNAISHLFIGKKITNPKSWKHRIAATIFMAAISPFLPANDNFANSTRHAIRKNRFEPSQNLTPIPGFRPYPLQFCERFIQEGKFTENELSIDREWNYFFTVPLDILKNNQPRACKI